MGLWLLGVHCRSPAGQGPVCTHLSESTAVIRPPSAPSLELSGQGAAVLQAAGQAGDKCAGRSLQSGLQCCSAAVRRPDSASCTQAPRQEMPASPAQPSPAPSQPSHSCLLGTLCLSLSPSPTEQTRAAQAQLDNKGLSISHHMIWSQVNHQLQFPFGGGVINVVKHASLIHTYI